MTAKKPAPRAAKAAAPAPTPVPSPAVQSRATQFSDAFTGFEQQLAAALATAGAWAKSHLRQRTLLVWLVPFLVIAALWFTDPDGGASTKVWGIRLVTAFVVAALAHWALKWEHDYPEADRRTLFGEVLKGNIAAGLALIAEAIVLFGFLSLFAAMARG